MDRLVKDELIACLVRHLTEMTGGDALACEDYVHMISRRHYGRVKDALVRLFLR